MDVGMGTSELDKFNPNLRQFVWHYGFISRIALKMVNSSVSETRCMNKNYQKIDVLSACFDNSSGSLAAFRGRPKIEGTPKNHSRMAKSRQTRKGSNEEWIQGSG